MNEQERLVATGFALGAIVGGAVVAIMSTGQRKLVAEQARRKLTELTDGRSIEEVSKTVRGEARKVAGDIADANRLLPRG